MAKKLMQYLCFAPFLIFFCPIEVNRAISHCNPCLSQMLIFLTDVCEFTFNANFS